MPGIAIAVACSAQSVPQLGKVPVKNVISAMTLEEKASVVVGMSMRLTGPPPGTNAGPGGPGGQAPQGPQIGQTQAIVPGAAGTTYAVPRLGIPSIVVADGPAGLRISPTRQDDENTYYCTAFPVSTLLASTCSIICAFSENPTKAAMAVPTPFSSSTTNRAPAFSRSGMEIW